MWWTDEARYISGVIWKKLFVRLSAIKAINKNT
jgi:hypothetical protein